MDSKIFHILFQLYQEISRFRPNVNKQNKVWRTIILYIRTTAIRQYVFKIMVISITTNYIIHINLPCRLLCCFMLQFNTKCAAFATLQSSIMHTATDNWLWQRLTLHWQQTTETCVATCAMVLFWKKHCSLLKGTLFPFKKNNVTTSIFALHLLRKSV